MVTEDSMYLPVCFIRHNPAACIRGTSTIKAIRVSPIREQINHSGGSHDKGNACLYEIVLEPETYDHLFKEQAKQLESIKQAVEYSQYDDADLIISNIIEILGEKQ